MNYAKSYAVASAHQIALLSRLRPHVANLRQRKVRQLVDIQRAQPGLGMINRLAGFINIPLESGQHKAPIVTAHLVGIDNKSNGPASTWAADEPLTTITTENRHAVITSNLVKLRGTSTAAPVDAPLGTASAGGTHHAEVRTTLSRAPASLERCEQIRAFLREYCPSLKDAEFPEPVMINGEMMEVVDIGLRKLAPRELANAQGSDRTTSSTRSTPP